MMELKNHIHEINELLLSNLTDILKINFFILDKNGKYIYRNSTLTSIVGDIEYGDKVSPEAWASCLEVMNTRKKITVEEEYQGQYFLSVKAPWIVDNEVKGAIGIAVDITEKKKAEKAKSDFLSNMEHDLRTPFSGIYGIAAILYDEETDPTKKEYLGYILTSSQQWMAIVDEVLSLVNQDEPKKFSIFEVSTVISEISDFLQAKLKLKDVQLVTNINSVKIYSDRFRFHRIILNLVSNAVKFTKEGNITISVSEAKDTIDISISDTGIGIPSEKLEDIFDKFYKLDPSNRHADRFQGSGIGLYVSRCYASEINGKIRVESKLGVGSTFILSVPKLLTLAR